MNEKNEKKKKTKNAKIDLRQFIALFYKTCMNFINDLFKKRSGVPRLVTQDRPRTESRLETKKQINSHVMISDVISKNKLQIKILLFIVLTQH